MHSKEQRTDWHVEPFDAVGPRRICIHSDQGCAGPAHNIITR